MQRSQSAYYDRLIHGQQGIDVMEMTHENGDLSEIYVIAPQGGFGSLFVMVFRPDGSLIKELMIGLDSLPACLVNSWEDPNYPFRVGCEWAEQTSGSPMLDD